MIKFRLHRGSLEESMKTQVELSTRQHLIDYVRASTPCPQTVFARPEDLEFKSQGPDSRIDWAETFLVKVDGVPVGMSDGTLDLTPTPQEVRETAHLYASHHPTSRS